MKSQIVHKRSLSRKIMFFDGLIVENEVISDRRVTFILKEDQTSQKFMSRVRQGIDKIRVGNVIEFQGDLKEDENAFIVKDYQTIDKWNNSSNGAFKPIPPDRVHPKGPTSILSGNKMTNNESKHKRARVFAEWIETTYSNLDRNQHCILDVAGGRGDLSFELSVRRDFKSHVVDPRSDAGNREDNYKRWQRKIASKTKRTIPDTFNSCFDREFFDKNRDWIIKKVKLIVGLHPDEATDSIVSLCLENQINFAIAPCCIFAAQNPSRRLLDGSFPNTYDLYVKYLREQSPELIQMTSLDFGGRNIILYTNAFL